MATEIHELADSKVTREEEPATGPAPADSAWIYRNLMFGEEGIASDYMPAITTHRDKMCCLFVNKPGDVLPGDKVLYYAWGTRQSWAKPKEFTGAPTALISPALASDGSVLHAVFVEAADDKHDLVHYQYDDSADRWLKRCGLAQHSSKAPALAAYHGQLYCAFVEDNSGNALLYTKWNPQDGWSTQKVCNGEKSKGTPALCLIGDQLHLLFAANNSDGKILDLVYNEAQDSWSRSASQPVDYAEYGVSATRASASSGTEAFMGFLGSMGHGDVLVSTYAGGSWHLGEEVKAKSYNTPSLAVQGGYLNCAYTARNDSRELLWSQRPVSGLDLTRWMSSVAGGKLLSSLSIPGTHDSCSVSDVPYVGAQYMTIPQQLNAGIRFLDLRCGLKDDVLYMYHGSYDLGIKLSKVLNEIYAWQDAHASEAVIASIKEDHAPVNSPDLTFAAAVKAQLDSARDRWYLQDRTPSLDEARHKLVLMRRYSATGSEAVGIDVTNWPDNSPRFDITTPGGVLLTVQDMYNLTGYSMEDVVNTKMSVIKPLLDSAGTGAPDRWYLNFTSGVSSDNIPHFWATPYQVAVGAYDYWQYVPGVNPDLEGDLAKRGPVRYGSLLMDFPELPTADVITTIVAPNL